LQRLIYVCTVITRPALAGRSNLICIHVSLLRRSLCSLLAKTKFVQSLLHSLRSFAKTCIIRNLSLRVTLKAGRSNLICIHLSLLRRSLCSLLAKTKFVQSLLPPYSAGSQRQSFIASLAILVRNDLFDP
jgi:hypothetical protein